MPPTRCALAGEQPVADAAHILFGPSAGAVFEKETATNHNIKTKEMNKSQRKGTTQNICIGAAAAGPGGGRSGRSGDAPPGPLRVCTDQELSVQCALCLSNVYRPTHLTTSFLDPKTAVKYFYTSSSSPL